MGDEYQYSPDRYFFPLQVETGEQSVAVDEGSGEVVINLATRARYYNHADASEDGTQGWALLAELESQLNAQLSGTYQVEGATPPGSDLVNSGVQIVRTDASGVSLEFQSSNWTLDPRLLGYPADQSTSVPADGAASPLSRWGVWASKSLVGGEAVRKGRKYEANVGMSTERVPQMSGRKFYKDLYRRLKYPWVAGAHVREGRGLDDRSAETAGLPAGDVHNAIEAMWPLFTRFDADGRPVPSIIGHGQRGEPIDSVYDQPFEVAILGSENDQWASPSSLWTLQRMAGEYYSVEWVWFIESGSYTQ